MCDKDVVQFVSAYFSCIPQAWIKHSIFKKQTRVAVNFSLMQIIQQQLNIDANKVCIIQHLGCLSVLTGIIITIIKAIQICAQLFANQKAHKLQ